MTTDHNEAMRLAEWLQQNSSGVYRPAAEAAALIRKQAERIAELEAERDKWKSAEHALSNSYVRVRAAIGAICPPSLETAELWAYVEATALALTAERDTLRAEVERTGNNRDMWKGQCERQAEQLGQLRAEVERLNLAEEGAAQAFGDVVQQKRDLEGEVKRLQSLLDGAYASIRNYSDTARKATQ